MSNRSVTYTLGLNSNVLLALQQHEQAALRLDDAISKINNTLATVGIGLGLHQLIETAKDWVHGAGDMEQALLRIKNVSDNATQGLFNKIFIREEVDKFKLDIQKATDTYGDFLTMVRGSGLAATEVRKLHDEVLTIGKVTGISDGQMDASVRNLGKLLEEGTLEGRHLRPLTYQMSGLMPYLSRELGLSNQELEKALATGKLTKAAIDSKVLLQAIEKYADDLKVKLPETLNTINSSLNDTGNSWLELKNNIVDDLKPELISFLHELKDGSIWLNENREQVERIGMVLITVVKSYAEWKVLLFSVNGLNGIIVGSIVSQTTALSGQMSVTAGLNAEIALLNSNLEILISLQTQAAISSGTFNTINSQIQAGAIGSYLGKDAAAIANSTTMAANAAGLQGIFSRITNSIASALTTAVMTVGIAWIGLNVLDSLGNVILGRQGDSGYKWSWQNAFNKDENGKWDPLGKEKKAGLEEANHQSLQSMINNSYIQGTKFYGEGKDFYYFIKRIADSNSKNPEFDKNHVDIIKSLIGYDSYGNLKPNSNADLYDILKRFYYDPHYLTQSHVDNSNVKKKMPSSDDLGGLGSAHVRGNSSHYITVHINELIGMNNPKFEVKHMTDMNKVKEVIGTEVTKILTDTVNDSQIIAGK